MRTSVQKARSRSGRSGDGEAPKGRDPLPDKPEETRYGIVFLYGAACIALSFLVLTGESSWYQAQAEGLSGVALALGHMLLAGVTDALLAFALSRGVTAARTALWLCFGAGLVVHALSLGEVIGFSPGLFICRVLATLMELSAIVLFQRRPSRDWFAALRER